MGGSLMETRAARAGTCEMDLSGGVCKVSLRVRAVSMRVLAGMVFFEGFDLLCGQFAGLSFGKVTEVDGPDPDPPQGD